MRPSIFIPLVAAALVSTITVKSQTTYSLGSHAYSLSSPRTAAPETTRHGDAGFGAAVVPPQTNSERTVHAAQESAPGLHPGIRLVDMYGVIDGRNAAFAVKIAREQAGNLVVFKNGMPLRANTDFIVDANPSVVMTFLPAAIPQPGDYLEVYCRTVPVRSGAGTAVHAAVPRPGMADTVRRLAMDQARDQTLPMLQTATTSVSATAGMVATPSPALPSGAVDQLQRRLHSSEACSQTAGVLAVPCNKAPRGDAGQRAKIRNLVLDSNSNAGFDDAAPASDHGALESLRLLQSRLPDTTPAAPQPSLDGWFAGSGAAVKRLQRLLPKLRRDDSAAQDRAQPDWMWRLGGGEQ